MSTGIKGEPHHHLAMTESFYTAQASLELTDNLPTYLLSAQIKGMHHHALLELDFKTVF